MKAEGADPTPGVGSVVGPLHAGGPRVIQWSGPALSLTNDWYQPYYSNILQSEQPGKASFTFEEIEKKAKELFASSGTCERILHYWANNPYLAIMNAEQPAELDGAAYPLDFPDDLTPVDVSTGRLREDLAKLRVREFWVDHLPTLRDLKGQLVTSATVKIALVADSPPELHDPVFAAENVNWGKLVSDFSKSVVIKDLEGPTDSGFQFREGALGKGAVCFRPGLEVQLPRVRKGNDWVLAPSFIVAVYVNRGAGLEHRLATFKIYRERPSPDVWPLLPSSTERLILGYYDQPSLCNVSHVFMSFHLFETLTPPPPTSRATK